MRLCIAGGRNLHPTIAEIDAAFDDLLIVYGDVTELVCGMAGGVDAAGLRWAMEKGIKVVQFPVTQGDYNAHGRYKAPKQRNWRMAHYTDTALVWWDGWSGGSAHMIAAMKALDKACRVVRPSR